jgi:hypothetical protein
VLVLMCMLVLVLMCMLVLVALLMPDSFFASICILLSIATHCISYAALSWFALR